MFNHHQSRLTLITGPSRSGKSEWAEYLAEALGKTVVYVATSQADPEDEEWQTRLVSHRSRRPVQWQTIEVPTNLVPVLRQASSEQCLLIDSLGTWLANFLDLNEPDWQQTLTEILQVSQICEADLIFVAEEVGWGVVPAYLLGRVFRDRLGQLVREIAAIADVTYLVGGGHVLNLSAIGTPLSVALNQGSAKLSDRS